MNSSQIGVVRVEYDNLKFEWVMCIHACVRACIQSDAYSQTGLTDLPRRYHVTSTEKLQSTLFCRSGWHVSGLGRMNLVDAVCVNAGRI